MATNRSKLEANLNLGLKMGQALKEAEALSRGFRDVNKEWENFVKLEKPDPFKKARKSAQRYQAWLQKERVRTENKFETLKERNRLAEQKASKSHAQRLAVMREKADRASFEKRVDQANKLYLLEKKHQNKLELMEMRAARKAPAPAKPGVGGAFVGGLVPGAGMLATGPAGIAATAGAAVAAGGALVAKESIDAFRDFEKKVAEVKTMKAGLSDAAIRDIIKKGVGEGMAIDDAGGALYDIVSAGIRGEQKTREVYTASMQLATAGLVGSKQAADATTSAMNVYGIAAREATDGMFATVKSGKITIEQYVSNVAPLMASMKASGVSYAEFNAMIADMTAKGIRPAMAATAARSFAETVTAPTPAIEALIKKKGLKLDFSKEHLQEVGIKGFMRELQDAVKGDTKLLARLIPRTEARAVFNAMASDMGEGFNNALGEQIEAGGATKEAFTEMTNTLDYQIKQFEGSVTKAAIGVGTQLAPALGHMLPKLTAASNDFQRWLEANPEKIKNIGDSLGSVAEGFISMLPALMNIVEFAADRMEASFERVDKVFELYDKVTGGDLDFGDAADLALLANPAGQLISQFLDDDEPEKVAKKVSKATQDLKDAPNLVSTGLFTTEEEIKRVREHNARELAAFEEREKVRKEKELEAKRRAAVLDRIKWETDIMANKVRGVEKAKAEAVLGDTRGGGVEALKKRFKESGVDPSVLLKYAREKKERHVAEKVERVKFGLLTREQQEAQATEAFRPLLNTMQEILKAVGAQEGPAKQYRLELGDQAQSMFRFIETQTRGESR